MREEISDDGRRIRSPWLRPADAAIYCGISLRAFQKACGDIPHGGTTRTRRYHVDALDRWLKGEFKGNGKNKK